MLFRGSGLAQLTGSLGAAGQHKTSIIASGFLEKKKNRSTAFRQQGALWLFAKRPCPLAFFLPSFAQSGNFAL